MNKLSVLVACVAIMGVGVALSCAGGLDMAQASPAAFPDVVAAMGVLLPASALDPAKRRGLVAVRADAGTGDDIKTITAKLNAAFEAFKAKNDERLDGLEKGKADAVLNEQVDRINDEITKLQSQLTDVATQAAAHGLNAGDGDETIKAAARFARERGAEVSVDDFKAYRDGMNVWMRRGNNTPESVKAAMSVGSDPDGGYTVTPDTSGRIVKRIYETSPMRQVASVTTIGTDRLEGFSDLDEASAGWVGETAPRSATGTPQLGKWEIPVHEIYAFPQVTQKLLDDSMFDIEGWLSEKVSDKFTRVENAAFLTGDGVLKPKGLLAYPTAATADATRPWGTFEHVGTGTSGGFGTAPNGSDKLIDLVYAVKAAYRGNANFMMSRATVAGVRKLKDGQGNYLWQPSLQAMSGGILLGHNIVEAEDMPVIGANSLSIAFGDFREAYQIVDRVGIRVLRDPLTNKPYVGFYTTKRVGGAAVHFEAVKFLKFA